MAGGCEHRQGGIVIDRYRIHLDIDDGNSTAKYYCRFWCNGHDVPLADVVRAIAESNPSAVNDAIDAHDRLTVNETCR